MNEMFTYWTPDEVAECLPVADDTYRALWRIVATEPPREFCETPDALWAHYALARYWDRLTAEEQADCNRAAREALAEAELSLRELP